MESKSERIAISKLSDDARAVAGGWFGMMTMLKSELTFATPSRITDRAKAALDELVAAGVISVEPFDPAGLRYRPLVPCDDHFRWIGRNRTKARWPLMHEETPNV